MSSPLPNTNIMWILLVIRSLENFIHFKNWNWWPLKKLMFMRPRLPCYGISRINIQSPRCALNASDLCRKGKGGPPRLGAFLVIQVWGVDGAKGGFERSKAMGSICVKPYCHLPNGLVMCSHPICWCQYPFPHMNLKGQAQAASSSQRTSKEGHPPRYACF